MESSQRKQTYDAGAYRRNHRFLQEIKGLMHGGYISRQEMQTLREQALSGDADGAVKGLARIMADRCEL